MLWEKQIVEMFKDHFSILVEVTIEQSILHNSKNIFCLTGINIKKVLILNITQQLTIVSNGFKKVKTYLRIVQGSLSTTR